MHTVKKTLDALFILAAFAALAIALASTSGCAAPAVRNEAAALPRREVGDRLIGAIRNDDFAGFRGCLHERVRERMASKDFRTSRRAMLERFGRITAWSHLTELAAPGAPSSIWRIEFERKSSGGDTIHCEKLFRIVTAPDGVRCKVLAVEFI